MKTKTLMPSTNTFLAAVVVLAAGAAHAQITNVSVEGQAAVIPGNPQQTIENAKRDARRNAVEQGAGVALTSNTIVRNYQLVTDQITTSSSGVLIDEQWGEPTDNPTKTSKLIKLTAKVSAAAIPNAVCAVVKAKHNPKVAIVLVEKVGNEEKWSTERGLVDALVTDAFIQNCFTIVEPGVKVTEVSANGDLPQDTINEIIKNSDAQYVLLGSAKMIQGSGGIFNDPNGQMRSYSVTVSAKLINTSNNEVEVSVGANTQVLGISPENAIKANKDKSRKLTDNVMDEVLGKVGQRWAAETTNGGRVQVVLQNCPNMATALAFKELVEKSSAGTTAERRSLRAGQATFDVSTSGSADALAAAIEGKKAGKGTLEVIEVAGSKLTLKLN
jgi:hypothetical protein